MLLKDSVTQTIVLVGLMGAGKTSVGRRLAQKLGLPFRDADAEIEAAAGCSVSEIFERFGEKGFRDGELKVIRRLLRGSPKVIATGGGAYMNEALRADIREKAVSVWLKAGVETLLERVIRTDRRPLLHNKNPKETLERLMAERYPIYEQADIIVDSGQKNMDKIVQDVLNGMTKFLKSRD